MTPEDYDSHKFPLGSPFEAGLFALGIMSSAVMVSVGGITALVYVLGSNGCFGTQIKEVYPFTYRGKPATVY